jgi:hypothetical protein
MSDISTNIETTNIQEQETLNNQEQETLNNQEQEIFLQKFNKKFEQEQEQIKMKIVKMEKEKLRKMNKKLKIKNIHDLTLGEILINTKNTYLDILTELLSFDYKDGISIIFTKEDRIFYIGVSLLILSFFIYILSFIFDTSNNNDNTNVKSDSDKINIYFNSSNTEPNEQITKSVEPNIKSKEIKIDTNDLNSLATESSENSDKLKINNKLDTSELKVVEL